MPASALKALAISAFLCALALAAACSDDPKPKPQADAEPTATAAPEPPRLNFCPPDVGQALCDFAASMEAPVRNADAKALVGSGGPLDTPAGRDELAAAINTTLPVTESHPRALRSIACPIIKASSDQPPTPHCTAKFALVFATITEDEITSDSDGILVLGYRPAPGGPQLDAHGIPEGPGRLYVIFGPRSTGSTLPGQDIQDRGLGWGIYPVEVLKPGEAPYDPTAPEVIKGVEVRPLRIGGETALPDDVVVYFEPVYWASDAARGGLTRVYRAPDGSIRKDEIFANAAAQHGPLAVVSWASDEDFGSIVIATCQEGRCRATGVGGWAGEFDVFRSDDGGFTWAPLPRVPAMAFPMAVTAQFVLFGHFLSRDDSTGEVHYRFFEHPSGTEVAPPAPNTVPRVVPGLGIVWEPGYTQRPLGARQSYDAAGNPITASTLGAFQARLIARAQAGALGRMALHSRAPFRPAPS